MKVVGRNWVGTDLKVAEVMTTGPLCVREEDYATKARSLFRKTGYRSLPVVDEDNRLVGIITRGDILNVTSTKSNIQVGGLMSSPIIYATPEEDIISVAKRLIKADVNRAPIVKSNSDMELVGILCLHDIMRELRRKGIKPRKKRVKEVMTENILTCSPADPITKVWAKIDDTGYSGIPVIKDGRPIGMITRKDIIKAGYARIEREGNKGRMKNPPIVEKLMRTPVISVSKECSVEEAVDLMLKFDIGRLAVVENGVLVGIIDREDVIKAYIGD